MLGRRLVLLAHTLAVSVTLGISSMAWAAQQPESQYFLPVEPGALDSHVHLQLMYSRPMRMGKSVEMAVLGVEAQYAFADRLEIGLNIPFISDQGQSWGPNPSAGPLGNVVLGLKGKLLGSSSGPVAVSLFLNTLLPTASEAWTREYANLHGGAAASFSVLTLTFGGDVGISHLIVRGENFGVLVVDLFAAMRILPFLGAQLAMQMGTPIYSDYASKGPGVAFCPAVQLFPLPFLHFGIGARIAANDNGRLLYNAGGRASLVFSAGLNF